MATHFPIEYRLESGTHVRVTKKDADTYEFFLTPTDGPAQQFVYREDEHTKAEWDEMLQFEQLDALREFWLKTEDII
jgi:hypothetical protein